jgi:hypothetical protein
MVAGGLLFLPWLPTFLQQLATTGTPWSEPGRLTAVPAALVPTAAASSLCQV